MTTTRTARFTLHVPGWWSIYVTHWSPPVKRPRKKVPGVKVWRQGNLIMDSFHTHDDAVATTIFKAEKGDVIFVQCVHGALLGQAMVNQLSRAG